MPTSTWFSTDGRIIYQECAGSFTSLDSRQGLQDVMDSEPAFIRAECSLIDLTQVTEMSLTADDLRTVAACDRELASINPKLAVAIVAPSDLVFGMVRMWQVFAEGTGWDVVLFRSREPAEAWIRSRFNSEAR